MTQAASSRSLSRLCVPAPPALKGRRPPPTLVPPVPPSTLNAAPAAAPRACVRLRCRTPARAQGLRWRCCWDACRGVARTALPSSRHAAHKLDPLPSVGPQCQTLLLPGLLSLLFSRKFRDAEHFMENSILFCCYIFVLQFHSSVTLTNA